MPDVFAFVLFAFVTSITPGPNNVMVAAAAANHGFKATMAGLLVLSILPLLTH